MRRKHCGPGIQVSRPSGSKVFLLPVILSGALFGPGLLAVTIRRSVRLTRMKTQISKIRPPVDCSDLFWRCQKMALPAFLRLKQLVGHVLSVSLRAGFDGSPSVRRFLPVNPLLAEASKASPGGE